MNALIQIVLIWSVFFPSIAYSNTEPPIWFTSGTITFKDYEIIGYGEGKTKREATQNAKADITSSISTNIKKEFNINLEVNIKNGKEVVNKNVTRNISEKSKAELRNLQIVKSVYKNGMYYVAIKYLTLPFAKIVKLHFKNTRNIKKEDNPYFINTQLLRELKNEFGFYPKIQIDKNRLIIMSKSFYITRDILKKLFSSISSESLSLEIPKKIKNNRFYFINVSSKIKGFLTLIQIYENGETSILLANQQIDANGEIEFPDSLTYNGIEAYLRRNQRRAKDLTIASICPDIKNFSYFDAISNSKEHFSKVYGKVFNTLMDCEVSSQIVTIVK